jgi:hypothetical protein
MPALLQKGGGQRSTGNVTLDILSPLIAEPSTRQRG